MPLDYWHRLQCFQDAQVPKLYHLRRAASAGLRVPPTWWQSAARVPPVLPPPAPLGSGPLIVRSASPTEDRDTSSQAGQFLSLIVRKENEFAEAVEQVVGSLPRDAGGSPRGAVFVQLLVAAEEAGVAFFDGFYFERTRAAGSNAALTSGQERGVVQRGHLARGDAWSDWLSAVYAVFGSGHGGAARLDIEYARDETGFVLLQVRPALFPIRRNETLTLANVRETVGEFPSPWLTSAMLVAARDVSFLAEVDPVIAEWEESLIVELGGRIWNNLSLIFREADRLGLPRRMTTDALGGAVSRPEDNRFLVRRFLASVPVLLRAYRLGVERYWHAERELRRLDEAIAAAGSLDGLFAVTVEGLRQLIATAATIAALLAGTVRLRRLLHLPPGARLITEEMMWRYDELRHVADAAERTARLDAWLARHGHRGPFESDPARPRFAELRELLLADLASAHSSRNGPPPAARPRRWHSALVRPFYRIDERREWYRDAFTRHWFRLRQRILEEGKRLVAAGRLDQPEDVFWLRQEQLGDVDSLRDHVRAARAEQEAVRDLTFPLTTTREEIEALLQHREKTRSNLPSERLFSGISLCPSTVEGQVVKADDVTTLFQQAGQGGAFGPQAILVVRALDPSWAVFFPRVAGVAAEIGGELSHASILLREARQPAIVNCAGVYQAVQTGDRIRLDGSRGLVMLIKGSEESAEARRPRCL
jgi:pyruvate,water dikinase